jgi:hypothetical protein
MSMRGKKGPGGKVGRRWGSKTPDYWQAKARERYHAKKAAMSPAEMADYKARRAAYAKEWRAKTRDTAVGQARRDKARERYLADVGQICAKARDYRLRAEYGISQADYEAMRKEQCGKCHLCHRLSALVVDHCHVTGSVRRLLCHRCNVHIGGFEAVVRGVGLERALAYVRLT